ncbi:hypothetical protein M434DRAFT_33111 [Hypoxylon sp. CO27-5]|nr:hypothetical protein M434DRAFT_33111 [Hypoxylon sp. CO27-5]
MVAVNDEAPLRADILVQRYEQPAQITRGIRPPGDEAAEWIMGPFSWPARIDHIGQFQRPCRRRMTPHRPISGRFSVIASAYQNPPFIDSRGATTNSGTVPLRGALDLLCAFTWNDFESIADTDNAKNETRARGTLTSKLANPTGTTSRVEGSEKPIVMDLRSTTGRSCHLLSLRDIGSDGAAT